MRLIIFKRGRLSALQTSMKRLLCILILCLAGWPFSLRAQQVASSDSVTQTTDSVVVSLLTCSPGSLVYELYGHTALRVREVGKNRQSDWVFNYGTFSFKQPNFVGRFVMGTPDYELGVLPYAYFYEEYVRSGRGIQEQKLNLTPIEAKRLVDALSENLLPENATYRYNIFYDNCVTRALRIVEQAVDGRIEWGKTQEGLTLREMVHEYSAPSPWNQFGQDLVLGAEADRPADRQAQMFAPLYASRYVGQAVVHDKSGNTRKLAAPALTLLPEMRSTMPDTFPITPMWCFGILLAFVLILTGIEYVRHQYYWQVDALFFFLQGLAGCIVAFLFFFSEHPMVGSNYLVALFNPLPLLMFPWLMKAASNRHRFKGMYLQLVMVQVALVCGLLGLQCYPVEVYLIILALDVRLVAHFLQTKTSVKTTTDTH